MPKKFIIVDIPDPQSLEAEFVYNFFTPDERYNENGDGRINGSNALNKNKINKLIEENAFDKQIARYVKLSWPQANTYFFRSGADQKQANFSNFAGTALDPEREIYEEEDFVGENVYWVYSSNDPRNKRRLRQKLQALSSIKGISFESSDQSKQLADLMGLGDGDLAEEINGDTYQSNKNKFINPLIKPTEQELVVNFIPKINLKTLYDQAEDFKLNSLVSVGDSWSMLNSNDDVSPLSSDEEINLIKEAARQISNNIGIDNAIIQGTIEDVDNPAQLNPGIISIQPIGYIIEKKESKTVGGISESIASRILITNRNINEYIDTRIKYDSVYSYVVKNVYRLEAFVITDEPVLTLGKYLKKIVTDIASKASPRRTVITREYIAPSPPDGVFYRFNYNKGCGLIITWQFPAGKSRDVKYFQVFRRSAKIGQAGELIQAIDQPFECIAEIDFNDTDTSQNPPPPKPEKVREDRIIKENYGRLFYEDAEFGREDSGLFGSFIYAICAVDAHGLSSGYSAQSLVTFNRTKNRIEIKNISKPGAPKQYPNFFIDPRMDDNITVDSFSQDVILDSGCKAIDVYFQPDARVVLSGDKSINVFSVAQSEGDTQNRYKLHAINLDLQKSDVKEIVINEALSND